MVEFSFRDIKQPRLGERRCKQAFERQEPGSNPTLWVDKADDDDRIGRNSKKLVMSRNSGRWMSRYCAIRPHQK